MATKNCPICGKVFNDAGGIEIVCPACKPAFDAAFDSVRDVLYDHPEYNIMQVAEITGLSVQRIKLYLREGRLIATNNTNASLLSCVDCGRPIEAGEYCPVCEYQHREKKMSGHFVGGNGKTRMHTRASDEKKDKD